MPTVDRLDMEAWSDQALDHFVWSATDHIRKLERQLATAIEVKENRRRDCPSCGGSGVIQTYHLPHDTCPDCKR